jgi:hypothetical protein
MSFKGKWIELEMLSEISQTQKDTNVLSAECRFKTNKGHESRRGTI